MHLVISLSLRTRRDPVPGVVLQEMGPALAMGVCGPPEQNHHDRRHRCAPAEEWRVIPAAGFARPDSSVFGHDTRRPERIAGVRVEGPGWSTVAPTLQTRPYPLITNELVQDGLGELLCVKRRNQFSTQIAAEAAYTKTARIRLNCALPSSFTGHFLPKVALNI